MNIKFQMYYKIILFLFIFVLGHSNVPCQEFECYPSDVETLILEYVNFVRQNPDKNELFEQLDAKKYFKNNHIPPFNQRMFEQEFAKIKPTHPIFYDPLLSLASRNHSKYMIVNGQSHLEKDDALYFTGTRVADRLRYIQSSSIAIGENCYLKSFGVEHCMLAFLIDWGDGLGEMQLDRPHRTNIFNKKALLIGNGCIPHGEHLAVTQIFSTGESNCDYYGGVVYTDRNKNGLYDIGEGHGGVQIIGNEGVYIAESYQSGLYVLKTKKGDLKTMKFKFLDFQKIVEPNDKNKKEDFVLDEDEEESLQVMLAKKRLEGELSITDCAWLYLHFKFKANVESSTVLEEMRMLHVLKIEVLKELMGESVIGLNQLLVEGHKRHKGSLFRKWLIGISYLSNVKSQILSLKNRQEYDVDEWRKIRKSIDMRKFWGNEVQYYLSKLINEIDFAIENQRG